MSGSRKWMRALVGAPMLAALPAGAEGPEDLATLLVAHDVVYNGIAWERHEADGRLLLRSTEGPVGRTSVGQWRVEEGARCLRWGQEDAWECYAVTRDGRDAITFTDDTGNTSTGRLVPR